MADKPQYERFITPKGVAVYPHLVRPDTKYDNDGVYSVKLAVKPEEAEPLIEKMTAVRDAFLKELDPKKRKTAKLADLYDVELDDEGEETGRLLLKAKQKALITTDKGEVVEKKIHFFDSANQKIEPKSLWGGSEIKLAGFLVPYYMASTKTVGVSLRLSAVQVFKLVEGDGPSAEAFGFEASEEGYVEETFENAGGDDADGEAEDF